MRMGSQLSIAYSAKLFSKTRGINLRRRVDGVRRIYLANAANCSIRRAGFAYGAIFIKDWFLVALHLFRR